MTDHPKASSASHPESTSTVATQASEVLTNRSNRLRWLELGLVSAVAFTQPILSSTFILRHGTDMLGPTAFGPFRWTSGLLGEIIALCLLWYVLKQSGRNFRVLGLSLSLRAFALGIPVALGGLVAYAVGGTVFQLIHMLLYGKFAVATSAKEIFRSGVSLFALPYFLLTPFFEELIVRGYVMTETAEITGSAALAVAISVLLQTSYHLYYGWIGAASLAFVFLAFAIYYSRTRLLLPVVVAHSMFDLYGFWSLFQSGRH